MKNKSMLNTKETAGFLGVSSATVYRMEKKGLINSVKTPGGQRRFNIETLNGYLKTSHDFEAPQNPSLYKKSCYAIKEPELAYENTITAAIDIASSVNREKNELFYEKDKITIYNADILKTNFIKENSVDLIVTSPPYNLDIKYNSHNDQMSYQEYLMFTKEWLSKCYRLAKDDGRFCLNIPLDKNKDGQQSVCADITSIAKNVGWKYHSTIIWNEGNISRRTAWGSWMSASAPYVIAPVEVIVILYKKHWKKQEHGESDTTRKEFIEWTNGVWTFNGESKKKIGHPAPFPIELPRRCIKLFSFKNGVILDPFLGSGSTLIAALMTGRRGIGVDIDKNYCSLAKKRMLSFAEQSNFSF